LPTGISADRDDAGVDCLFEGEDLPAQIPHGRKAPQERPLGFGCGRSKDEPRIARHEDGHGNRSVQRVPMRVDHLPDAARFPVPGGDLRAMVAFTGLNTISEDGLEGEDRCIIYMWPGRGYGTTVLKQWDGD